MHYEKVIAMPVPRALSVNPAGEGETRSGTAALLCAAEDIPG
jgi:hypothetical protein